MTGVEGPHSGDVRDGHAGTRAERSTRVHVTRAAKTGISFGSALAIAISWSEHHSILWAIVHGILSWLYVVYYTLTR